MAAKVHIKLIQSAGKLADGAEVIITYGLPVCMVPTKVFQKAAADRESIRVDWPIKVDCPTCILRTTLNGLG